MKHVAIFNLLWALCVVTNASDFEYGYFSYTILTETSSSHTVTVDGIANRAFYDVYNKLTKITIPESVPIKGYYHRVVGVSEGAFKDWTQFKEIVLPEHLKTIGKSAFEGCKNLETITIPDYLESIAEFAFFDCIHLKDIQLISDPHSPYYKTDHKTPSGQGIATLPNTVNYIGSGAFRRTSLSSINIPTSLVKIEPGAFSYLGIKTINIPNSVKSIGNYAFSGCYFLSNVTIPSSVTCIGDGAFKDCNSLTELTIPESVISIGEDLLTGTNLKCITVLDGNPNYDSRANALVHTATNAIIRASNSTKSIPNTIVAIGNNAFQDLDIGGYLTIPSSVTSIGDYAFKNCNTSVILQSPEPPSIGLGNFPQGFEVYYPVDCGYDLFYGTLYSYYTKSSVGYKFFDTNDSFDIHDNDFYNYDEVYMAKPYKNKAVEWRNYTRLFHNYEWQALYIPIDVPYEGKLAENVEVAKFCDIQTSTSSIKIELVTSGMLTANTPYLVRLREGKNLKAQYAFSCQLPGCLKATQENEFKIGSNFILKPTYRKLVSTVNGNSELEGKYALVGGEFRLASHATLRPFRFYIEPINSTSANNTISLSMDDVTGIKSELQHDIVENVRYNLNGQVVSEHYKGIVIVDGKKVLVK